MKPKGLDLLREPFPKNQISKLPKPTKKDNPKGTCKECGGYHGLPAVHLDYVGHAALTDRLLEADTSWTWEPLALENGLPAFDKNGGLWIKLTVCGVTRLGYGNAENASYKEAGTREKEVIGDALRNAAMRFGAALDLWHKGDLHQDDNANAELPKPQQEDLGHQPMPKAPVTPKMQKNALADRIFGGGPHVGKTFYELSFGDKEKAKNHLAWCKKEIKEKGLANVHTDTSQFVDYAKSINLECHGITHGMTMKGI